MSRLRLSVPIIPLLGTLEQQASLLFEAADFRHRLQSTGYFHSYCSSILATSAWVFLGFEQALGFNLVDLYQQLCDLVPRRTARDYAFVSVNPDPVTALRFEKAGLSVLASKDLTSFLNRISSELMMARRKRQEQLRMPLVLPGRPYKYLDSYSESDADLFYGRAEDAAELFGSIVGNEAVVLYGNSGVREDVLA